MLGGTATADVWVTALRASWVEASCTARKPAVCGAVPHTVPVSVTLPPATGAITPANAAPAAPASFVFAPPRPTLRLADGQASATLGRARFAVNFNSDVHGLGGDALAVSAAGGPATVLSWSAAGGPRVWELEVVLTAAVDACPAGYTPTSDGSLCLRAFEELRTRDDHAHSSCGQFALATLSSPASLELAASLRGTVLRDYW